MVTVILCSYHGEKYIDAQRRSILKQQTEVPFVLREYDDEIRLSGSACSNFLSAIREAPDSDYYMLSDQDDIWHPDKIDRLYNEITKIEGAGAGRNSGPEYRIGSSAAGRGAACNAGGVAADRGAVCNAGGVAADRGAVCNAGDVAADRGAACAVLSETDIPVLVFSDAAVVDDDLKEISPSFVKYQGLTSTRLSLPQLLIMNQVTGAACIFNRALKKLLEEHPMPQHAVMHDQWLALMACAFGRIGYLDEALYDYRQHGDNVLGARKGNAVREGRAMVEAGHCAGSRAAYDALSAQAGEFLEQYRDMLSPEQTDILRHFAELPRLSKMKRICTVLRYGFTYNRFYRTLGELVNI